MDYLKGEVIHMHLKLMQQNKKKGCSACLLHLATIVQNYEQNFTLQDIVSKISAECLHFLANLSPSFPFHSKISVSFITQSKI
jgi:hypothetical protein